MKIEIAAASVGRFAGSLVCAQDRNDRSVGEEEHMHDPYPGHAPASLRGGIGTEAKTDH